jgi:hypothetical protein
MMSPENAPVMGGWMIRPPIFVSRRLHARPGDQCSERLASAVPP